MEMTRETMDAVSDAAVRMEDVEAVLKENNYDKGRLVPILQAVQERYKWLSKDLICYVARSLGLPPARVYGVATFYAHFALKPKGRHVFRLCDGTACHVKGSTKILEALRAKLKLKDGQDTTADMAFTVETVSCLGACGLAPVLVVDEAVHGQLKAGEVEKIVDEILEKDKAPAKKEIA